MIDPVGRSTAHPIMPRTGEGMTGSLSPGLPTAGPTGTDERNVPAPHTPPGDPVTIFPATHIVARTTPASRPYGR